MGLKFSVSEVQAGGYGKKNRNQGGYDYYGDCGCESNYDPCYEAGFYRGGGNIGYCPPYRRERYYDDCDYDSDECDCDDDKGKGKGKNKGNKGKGMWGSMKKDKDKGKDKKKNKDKNKKNKDKDKGGKKGKGKDKGKSDSCDSYDSGYDEHCCGSQTIIVKEGPAIIQTLIVDNELHSRYTKDFFDRTNSMQTLQDVNQRCMYPLAYTRSCNNYQPQTYNVPVQDPYGRRYSYGSYNTYY